MSSTATTVHGYEYEGGIRDDTLRTWTVTFSLLTWGPECGECDEPLDDDGDCPECGTNYSDGCGPL